MKGYYFRTGSTSSIDPLYTEIGSIYQAHQQDPSSRALAGALKAISLAYSGTQSGNKGVVEKARRAYTDAISTLREAFQQKRGPDVGKVLMAVRLCTGFEVSDSRVSSLRSCDGTRVDAIAVFHMQ